MTGTCSKYWIFLLILFTACTAPVGKERFSPEIWVGSNRTLVVMLPTMGGDGSFYESQGFIQELRDRGFTSHCKVLALIKKYLETPGNERRLALGFGTDDAFARQNQMLAELIAPDQVFIVQGGRHDWNTWKMLFDQVLDYIEKNRIG